jgi:hypothetical protein
MSSSCTVLFLQGNTRAYIMSHDHDDHSEAEQNEIGGPVVLALFLFAILIISIYFLS